MKSNYKIPTYEGTITYEGKTYAKVDPFELSRDEEKVYLMVMFASPEKGNYYDFVNYLGENYHRATGELSYYFVEAGTISGFEVTEGDLSSERVCVYEEIQ